MRIIDLSQSCLEWLTAEDPVESFIQWYLKQGTVAQSAFSGIIKTDMRNSVLPLINRFPREAIPPLERLITDRSWFSTVEATCRHVSTLIPELYDTVEVVVLVGFGGRSASQAFWRGTGYAFLWLEHYLPSGSAGGLLDLGVAGIPVWLGHEMAHAGRYSLPGTASPIPARMSSRRAADFFPVLESTSIGERILDEGLATYFSHMLLPDVPESDILYLPEEALTFLTENRQALVADRRKRFNLLAENPPSAAQRDLFIYEPDRLHGPWTIDRPPTRWGYWWGYCLARELAFNNWATLLKSKLNNISLLE